MRKQPKKSMDKFEKALEMSDEDFLRRFGYSKKAMKKWWKYCVKHMRQNIKGEEGIAN